MSIWLLKNESAQTCGDGERAEWENGRGACSWSELGSKRSEFPEGALSANEHCVLHMLSRRTASSPNSKMSLGQLLILRDWHCA